MLKHIDHLAIAVTSLDEAIERWKNLGFTFLGTEVVEEQGVKVAMFEDEHEHIELLEPLGPDTPVGKFLAKRGPGLHHTCFRVDNIVEAIQTLKARGYRMINDEPRVGAGGDKIAFIHPKSTDGALIEIKEKA